MHSHSILTFLPSANPVCRFFEFCPESVAYHTSALRLLNLSTTIACRWVSLEDYSSKIILVIEKVTHPSEILFTVPITHQKRTLLLQGFAYLSLAGFLAIPASFPSPVITLAPNHFFNFASDQEKRKEEEGKRRGEESRSRDVHKLRKLCIKELHPEPSFSF